ncbi:MAG: hypothetical protein RLZZ301_65 [Bacteroidota bacterium]|jgi:hypothetical protein
MKTITFSTFFLVLFMSLVSGVSAQVLTKEDSLSAGLIASPQATVLSGYGSMHYENNLTTNEATANVDRVVLFFGHKFSKKIFFFSELEIEDAKIDGSGASGEFALEQAFLKFQLNRHSYLTTGLFIPRLGIINENHLPTTFNGVQRPFVEQYIIPSTWREMGIGYYGFSQRIAGLNYSLAFVNGLSSAGFENGSGIREGRAEGRNAQAGALALTGALLYYHGPWRLQVSGYYGGSAGLTPTQADSLQLNSGLFGTPVGLLETNAQYHGKRLTLKALATTVLIPDAAQINLAYANNTASQLVGTYLEGAYAIWQKEANVLRLFGRYEFLDMNFKQATNGINNPTLRRQYVVAGLSYLPHPGVVIKLDYTYRITGNQNPDLIVDPFLNLPFYAQQQLISLGVGFSF